MDKIGPGTEEEVELRACSVHAVEKMRELISLSFVCKNMAFDVVHVRITISSLFSSLHFICYSKQLPKDLSSVCIACRDHRYLIHNS